MKNINGPIGVFDSGYGGLTILKQFTDQLPEYDFIYLGDNARTPYGNRSYETIYKYTLEAVEKLFSLGCNLVILACNTASAKALRTIQQVNLPQIDSEKRVLGVIRPTIEILDSLTNSNKIGIMATSGTVNSESYLLEVKKFFPDIILYQQPCPLWVPLVENGEIDNEGAEYFVEKYIKLLFNKCKDIDTIILGCTHYPVLIPLISKYLPKGVKVVSQDAIVAKSLVEYLNRHPEIDAKCLKNASIRFLTTDSADVFNMHSKIFFNSNVHSEKIHL